MRNVTRADILARSDEPGDPASVREGAHRFRLGLALPIELAERQAPRLEHARDEIVQGEERIARIVPEALLQVAPLRFPFMPIEPGLLHAWVVPRVRDCQTPQ